VRRGLLLGLIHRSVEMIWSHINTHRPTAELLPTKFTIASYTKSFSRIFPDNPASLMILSSIWTERMCRPLFTCSSPRAQAHVPPAAGLANVVPSPILKGRFGYARICEHRRESGCTSECRCVMSALFPLAILEKRISAHGLLAVLAVPAALCAAAQTRRFVSP
jgi:hypothetical protein